MSAPATEQKAKIASESATESLPRALKSSELTPPFPSYRIHATKIALATSFGHHHLGDADSWQRKSDEKMEIVIRSRVMCDLPHVIGETLERLSG